MPAVTAPPRAGLTSGVCPCDPRCQRQGTIDTSEANRDRLTSGACWAAALLAHARQPALGDIPRPTAPRLDKVGLIDGDVRLTYRELDGLLTSRALMWQDVSCIVDNLGADRGAPRRGPFHR